MLQDVGVCGEECPSQILLSTIDAHCETVALALAEHVVEVLADTTRKTVSRTCLDNIHREFLMGVGEHWFHGKMQLFDYVHQITQRVRGSVYVRFSARHNPVSGVGF